MSVITSAMRLNQITLIKSCSTRVEIFDRLDSVFEQTLETHKILVHGRFYQYQINSDETISQHVAKIENIAKQINSSRYKNSFLSYLKDI